MPSLLHEALIALFRNEPRLAPEILSHVLDVDVPPFAEITFESAELHQIVPAEFRADLVVLLLDGGPVLAIVVEVQLSRDNDKHLSWPVYLTALRARLGCPTSLLVVCADDGVAAWCSQPIEIGHQGFTLRPHVLGPGAVPFVTDDSEAVATPELAVLSVLAHGHSERALEVALAALTASARLDNERCVFYHDLVMSALNDAARSALEEMMRPANWEPQSDFVRKHFYQGKAEGLAEGLVNFLSARGLEVSALARETILSCRDLEQLDEWTRRAATIESVEELFR